MGRSDPEKLKSETSRVLRTLALFSAERPVWTAREAAAELDVSLATAYRYFQALRRAALVDAHRGTGFVLGPAVVELDRQLRLGDPLLKAAVPIMGRLAQQSRGAVLLCRSYRDRVLCVHQERHADAPAKISYERGRAMPLWKGATSKIILANLPDAAVTRLLEHAGEDSSAGRPLARRMADLRGLRRERVCVTRGEIDPGVVGIAVLLREGRAVLGSLSIVIGRELDSDTNIARLRRLLVGACDEIEAGLDPIRENFHALKEK
jgi:DNA-binding IclR family transcriptional regulator